jgi:hypothetical protein
MFLLSPIVFSADWFTENLGQVKNQLGESNNDVLYILNDDGLTVTLRKRGFSYEAKRITNVEGSLHNSVENYKFTASIERIDFVLPNQPTEVLAESKSKSFVNVYSSVGDFNNISQYGKVTYKNVSPGIDIEFIIEEGDFKYNILATPGADLTKFFIKINSNKAPSLKNEKLVLRTKFGNIEENIPFSYLVSSQREITVNYNLEGQKLYFTPSTNSRTETLVIDPVPDLIWNTYFGGGQYDLVNDIAISSNDEIYQTGFTMSLANISTSGAFLETYQGDLDAFISKFDIDGNIIWSTYYAGPQSERVYSIASDSLDNCYISGSTFSTTNIATFGAHQEVLDGSDDLFFLKLLPNGQRDWCTYHGGNGHDFVTNMTILNDTIYAVGHTTSTNNMSSPGAHMVNNTTSEAGHITLFNVNGDFLWGTYFGDSGNNSIEGIAVNNGSIFITGRTNSATGISTLGTHQETFAGFTDGFISRFNKEGSQIWGTYFGGDYSDKSKDITIDEEGDLYICGDASSLNQISTVGAHQENRLSSEQAFVSKFSSDGQQIWGTYTGGDNTDYLNKIIYKNGALYVGGQTLSENEVTTPDVFQEVKSDGYDLFMQKFDTTGLFLFGTYFGSSANEDLTGIALTNNEQIVISGNTSASSVNFTTINSHQENYGGGTSDGFLAQFCQPIKPQIQYDQGQLISSLADQYEWYFEGTPLNEYNQSITPTSDGDYFVITSNNGLCEDTSDVFPHSTIGIKEDSQDLVKVYPNPTNEELFVEIPGLEQVHLIDINGKEILSKSGKEKVTLDLKSLSNGIYLVRIEGVNFIITKKVIKN